VFAIYTVLVVVGSYYSFKCFEMLRMSATLSTSNVQQEVALLSSLLCDD
jgi:hypothetical protein